MFKCALLVIALAIPTPSFSYNREIPNLQEVTDHILRGGRPTSQDLNELRQNYGLEVILDVENNLDAIRKEKVAASKLGVEFISIPMDWDVTPKDKDVDQILNLMKSTEGTLFIHCKHGRDRTGMIVGLYRVLIQGWTPKKAYQEMLDLGFGTEFKMLDNYFKKRSGYYNF